MLTKLAIPLSSALREYTGLEGIISSFILKEDLLPGGSGLSVVCGGIGVVAFIVHQNTVAKYSCSLSTGSRLLATY